MNQYATDPRAPVKRSNKHPVTMFMCMVLMAFLSFSAETAEAQTGQIVGQVTDELERALARISNPIYQLFYRGYASNIAVQCQFLHPMFTWVGDRVETGHNMTSAGIHQAVLRPL